MAVLNKKGSGVPAGAVYIGRGSRWGNPFVMKSEADRDSVCDQYERHLVGQLERGEVSWQDLASLNGKDLVCFCAPKRCHGHVLEAYAAAAQIHIDNQAAVATECGPMEYRLIVAGGRDFNDYERLHGELFSLAENELADYAVSIVSGLAKGADALAVQVARNENIQCHPFPAQWDNINAPGAIVRTNRYGKLYNAKAGMDRNHRMGDFADGLLAFWDGKSKGTADMIKYMRDAGKDVRVINY